MNKSFTIKYTTNGFILDEIKKYEKLLKESVVDGYEYDFSKMALISYNEMLNNYDSDGNISLEESIKLWKEDDDLDIDDEFIDENGYTYFTITTNDGANNHSSYYYGTVILGKQ
jgi:hypothetical protein